MDWGTPPKLGGETINFLIEKIFDTNQRAFLRPDQGSLFRSIGRWIHAKYEQDSGWLKSIRHNYLFPPKVFMNCTRSYSAGFTDPPSASLPRKSATELYFLPSIHDETRLFISVMDVKPCL